jgi:DNA polymerase III delta subunit
MLSFFYGTDRTTRLEAVTEYIKTLQNPHVERLNEDTFSERVINTSLDRTSLFGDTQVVILEDCATNNQDIFEYIKKNTDAIISSQTVVIATQDSLLKKDQKYLSHPDISIQHTGDEKKEGNRSKTLFALTDALAEKSKKDVWVLYLKECEQGTRVEEIFGVLFWILKILRLRHEKDIGEAEISKLGIHPFVWQKAGRGAKNFTKEKLDNMIVSLTTLFHDARKKGIDLEILLEEWILREI